MILFICLNMAGSTKTSVPQCCAKAAQSGMARKLPERLRVRGATCWQGYEEISKVLAWRKGDCRSRLNPPQSLPMALWQGTDVSLIL